MNTSLIARSAYFIASLTSLAGVFLLKYHCPRSQLYLGAILINMFTKFIGNELLGAKQIWKFQGHHRIRSMFLRWVRLTSISGGECSRIDPFFLSENTKCPQVTQMGAATALVGLCIFPECTKGMILYAISKIER